MAGSTRSGSYGSSSSSANRFTPTTTRAPSSICRAISYADRSISDFWKPCSIAATAPPRASTCSISSSAAASTSSVSDSTTYEPANGSTVLVTSVSYASTCWVRSASRADFWVGSAIASSKEFVCSDWVPPSTAASAWTATRTRFTSGCCAVSWTPAVWVWNRSICDFGLVAPNRSRITRAQIRRAARNLATSSSSVVRETKKKDNRGANSSTASPAARAASTYAIPSARVNAISCAGVAPASAMW